MQQNNDIATLRSTLAGWRRGGERIALVPTMGNLHQGHLELVRQGRRRADRVVASIFVNPLQFGPKEDLAAYPHTPELDAELLQREGCDLLFRPSEEEIYPHGREGVTAVDVPGIGAQLCGASRPGHFRGVATVVAKLFNLFQPDIALFGEKDFQQLVVIRRMVADLNFPVEVVGVPTVRETDGLALSSRNGYLTAEERSIAPRLYQELCRVAGRVQGGECDYTAIEGDASDALKAAGFRPDYVSIRRAADLMPPAAGELGPLVVLAAAWLGKARLIDNMMI